MRSHLTGIDHAVVACDDLDQALTDFERLGFTTTARGFHTMGTANHCIMFEHDYFELLGLPSASTVEPPASFSRLLARGRGLNALAFHTDDALLAREELLAAGLEPGEARDFSRPVETGGGLAHARFRILDLPPGSVPGAYGFACEHFSRELVWLPDTQRHPNGACGLDSVLLASASPAETADAYGRLLDVASEPRDYGASVVCDHGARIDICHPDAVAGYAAGLDLPDGRSLPAVLALGIQVRDPARTRAWLTGKGVPFRTQADGALLVSAAHAQGTALLFVPASRSVSP
ncbi:VOC family protein [Paludibacterium yongneupense]|uniref:VOC family protein n=1 Tax=Paludibacterium yongneupense TaxID=400061 RepID=UPI0004094A80|nr:VOC family protein [Paludibacterium yongneupense]